MSDNSFPVSIKNLAREDYAVTFAAMQAYTDGRNLESEDQLWIVEHDPVFTLGLAADRSHLLNVGEIPVIQADRGGEVTFHGPGQVVIYALMDLKRQRRTGMIREFVTKIEQAVIDTLAGFGIAGERKVGAPGIYISRGTQSNDYAGAKIAALGLKVRANGCTYHGVSLNVAMDLQPFSLINPCGYPALRCVDMRTLGVNAELAMVQNALASHLTRQLA
jgi:lipoyl(octanoyl) transferase